LPGLLDQSWALDWSAALAPLESAANLYMMGRGLGLGAAQETALKCKETCGLYAEAFSSGVTAAGAIVLPALDVAAEVAPILPVQSAYRLTAMLAVRRGFDPDHPAHLLKVTETV
jgi:glutamine---fructose-6-phosphate transaminase (isomerizing)